jgi:hypothetical protein
MYIKRGVANKKSTRLVIRLFCIYKGSSPAGAFSALSVRGDMQKASDSCQLVDKVRTANAGLIGIDGIDGSGKTTLSKKLSDELGYTHINLDDYVDRNCGTFVEHIRYDELLSSIHSTQSPVILEGVCLLAVLEKLQRKADLLIYVRRITDYGSWREEDNCDIVGDVDELILDANACDIPPLVEELIRYHHRYAPHRRADIIYDRTD